MDGRPFSSALASYFVSKTKTWQTTPFANNAGRAAAHNVKFHKKVHDRQGLQNLSAQILVILLFYFLILLLKKPNHKETTVYDSSWIKNSKFFGCNCFDWCIYSKCNNESVPWLFSTLDEHFQSHYE